MKRNIILLTIIIISIFQASSSRLFTLDGNDNNQMQVITPASQPGGIAEHDMHKQQPTLWTIIYFKSPADRLHHREEEDDCKTHFFHFDRNSSSRRFYKLWCILARMIVIISHLSVLIYVFKGFFIH